MFMAFDFGFKRIGVAVGHGLTGSARPLPTLQAKQGEPQWDQIKHMIQDWRPEALIVGLPTRIDGQEQYTTTAARHFAESLKTHFRLPVHLVDERLSTVEARARIFEQGGYKQLKRTEIDSMAACIILNQWIQVHGRR